MSAEDICRLVLGRVDGALSCAVLELDSLALLGFASTIADVSTELVIGAVREAWLTTEQELGPLSEVQVTSGGARHFLRSAIGGKRLWVLTTGSDVPAGLAWAELKEVSSAASEEATSEVN